MTYTKEIVSSLRPTQLVLSVLEKHYLIRLWHEFPLLDRPGMMRDRERRCFMACSLMQLSRRLWWSRTIRSAWSDCRSDTVIPSGYRRKTSGHRWQHSLLSFRAFLFSIIIRSLVDCDTSDSSPSEVEGEGGRRV